MSPDPAAPAPSPGALGRALRAARRIRSKLIFLHTAFSLSLAVVLLLVLRTPVTQLVEQAEHRECQLALELWRISPQAVEQMESEGLSLWTGPTPPGADTARPVPVDDTLLRSARDARGRTVLGRTSEGAAAAALWDETSQRAIVAWVRSPAARAAADRVYLMLTIILLGVYGLIALTMEVFVLPRQVYEPIDRLRRADAAVQEGRRTEELIPDRLIPSDELGEIMRSRNRSILKLRDKERELERVLGQIEVVASELRRKNHLLETAQRNLADQDRLASLGMMSAGIAHELNTPLAVLKGSVERMAEAPGQVPDPDRVALMLRVVNRLERLGESLLDFARVRPPASERIPLRDVITEAWTLVSLDRESRGITFTLHLPDDAHATGDPDRITQVFVNLLRNASDAAEPPGEITVRCEVTERNDQPWVSITVRDTGPGIDPAVLPRLFEPFASTRLDARGTGLGLAVSEGIIREHGGILLARNIVDPDAGTPIGAEFEVMLPVNGPEPAPATLSHAQTPADKDRA